MPAKPKSPFPDPAARLPGEADILATVLADLSDLNAKLVYADWLEEHGDKRGPLLRKCVNAYRDGKELPSVRSAPEAWRKVVGLILMAGLHDTVLTPLADKILTLARPMIAYEYKHTPKDKLPLGTSKFGGRPDMPPDAEWPLDEYDDPMSFLMQFNLAELQASPVARELPATGMLSLFCMWDYGEDFTDTNWRLLYFPDTKELARHDHHEMLDGTDTVPPARLTFTEVPTLPDDDSLWSKELLRAIRKIDGGKVAYSNLRDGMGGYGLLGHPYTCEGDILGKKSVRHLLTTGENGTEDFWPDGNIMYITIAEADLKKARFDRAKATLQTF